MICHPHLIHRLFQLQSRWTTPKQVNNGKRALRLISYFRAKLDDLGLVIQRTGKYCSIRRIEYPEFQTGIFGRMESAPFRRHFEWRHNFVTRSILPRASLFVGRVGRFKLYHSASCFAVCRTCWKVHALAFCRAKNVTIKGKLGYCERWKMTEKLSACGMQWSSHRR